MKSAVAPSTRTARLARCRNWLRPHTTVPSVITLVSVALGSVLYVAGDQPIAYDALGYVDLGQRLYRDGLWTFMDKLRTYGYPAVLSLLMHLVGPDGPLLPIAIFVAQLAVYLAVAFVAARRVARILGQDALLPWLYAALALNLFALAYTVVALTESLSASLILLATVMAVPLPTERGRPSTRAMAASLLSASFAAAIRPANIAVVGAIGAVWLIILVMTHTNVRHTLGRLTLAGLFVALPLAPQSAFNLIHWGTPTPLIVERLYDLQLKLGVVALKYATLYLQIDAVPAAAYYNSPFTGGARTPADMLANHPAAYLLTLGLHVYALLDQDFLFPYVRDLDPWYRWPVSIINYALVAAAIVGLVQGLRSPRRRLFVTLLWVVAVYIAIYLPTTVEARFGVAVLVLLSIPAAYALGAGIQPGTLRRDALLAVPICLGILGACFLSSWMQGQAPLIADIRALQARQAAGLDSTPEAQLSSAAPAIWRAGADVTYLVEVTNPTTDTWAADGLHEVLLRVAYIQQASDRGTWVETDVPLPQDIGPGETVSAEVSVRAPAEPDVYALRVTARRAGIPEPSKPLDQEIRVASTVDGGGDQSVAIAPVLQAPSARIDVSPPSTWRVGQHATYSLAVQNTGTETWRMNRGYPTVLVVRFARYDDSTGNLVGEYLRRFPLPRDVPPGDAVTETIAVESPPDARRFELTHLVETTEVGQSAPGAEDTIHVTSSE